MGTIWKPALWADLQIIEKFLVTVFPTASGNVVFLKQS